MTNIDDIFQNQVLEFRRGSIVLAIVSILRTQKHYGYSLLRTLEQSAFPVDGSTLYPLLRRLEKQGVLQSEWNTADSRPRKYYQLTNDGEKLYKKLYAEWLDMNKKIHSIIMEDV
jgi:DNA-binding PadR family transcriptional regulator